MGVQCPVNYAKHISGLKWQKCRSWKPEFPIYTKIFGCGISEKTPVVTVTLGCTCSSLDCRCLTPEGAAAPVYTLYKALSTTKSPLVVSAMQAHYENVVLPSRTRVAKKLSQNS